MNVIEVNDSLSAREFIEFPGKLYRNDTNWISPLHNDVEAVFDPKEMYFSPMASVPAGC